MALTLTINGVDRSNLVLWRSLTMDQVLTSQVDTLSFSVQKFGTRTFIPQAFDEVILSRDGIPIFGGVIVSINDQMNGVDNILYNITCKDYSEDMNRRLVVERFQNVPAINIIIEILNRYINRGSRISIASFESSETWSGGAIDTDYFRLGDQARMLTSNGSIVSMGRNIYLNLQPTGYSDTDYIDIDVHVQNINNLESAVLRLGDANLTNYFELDITNELTSEGWNLSHNLINSFSETGSPSWTNIRAIEIELKAINATTCIATYDNWQVVKANAFTRNNAMGATQQVNYIAYNYEYPSQCLQRLAELFKWEWYVDEDRDIHFFGKFNELSGFNLTDTNGNYIPSSLQVNRNVDQLRNSIYVRGGDFLDTTITEDLSVQADGSNSIFLLGYGYANTSLQINSIDIPVGTDNLQQFSDNEAAKQIIEGELPVNLGDIASNTYQSMQVICTKQGRRGTVRLRIRAVGSPADNINVQIFSDNGSNQPSTTALSNVSSLSGGSLSTSFEEYTFSLTEVSTNDLFLDVNDKYHIRVTRSGALNAANYFQVEVSDEAEYEGYAYTGNAVPAWTQQQWAFYFVETIDFDVLWNFKEKNLKFNIAPLAGDLIEWTGDPYKPVFVLYKANASITEYGEKQFKVSDLSIKTKEGARQRALQEVLAWSQEVSEASFITLSNGLRAGQTINVQSDIRGINTDYIIQRITARARGSENLEYNVSLVTTKTFGILYYLQQQISKDDRNIEIDENELEDKIESISENISFSVQYTTTLYTGKVWSNDAGTTPNALVWSGGADHIWI